jgi:pimeloyl-ACP methyl ester carboxylesterase
MADHRGFPDLRMRVTLCAIIVVSFGPVVASAQVQPAARVFHSEGVPIHYVDTGRGDPVLLIHGFGGRLEFWEATGIIAGLTAAGFRVIAYDARGHGHSGKPYNSDEYGDEDVDDAVRLLDHLSIDRVHVVGYSRGSEIASQLVVRHAKRVRTVVFGAWGVGNPVASLSLSDCLATVDALDRGAFPLPLARALRPEGAPPPSPEQQAAVTRQFAAANDMRALAAAFRSGCEARRVTVAALRATGVPALAIVGARDGMAPSVQAMGRELGGALEVAVVREGDHYTTPRHPEFLVRLTQFLKERRRESR